MRHYLYVDFAEMPTDEGRPSAGAKSKSRDTFERLKLETCFYLFEGVMV